MAREMIDVQLTPDERSLLLRYGYPFEQIEQALKASPLKVRIQLFLLASSFAVATCCPLPEYLRLGCGRLGPRLLF